MYSNPIANNICKRIEGLRPFIPAKVEKKTIYFRDVLRPYEEVFPEWAVHEKTVMSGVNMESKARVVRPFFHPVRRKSSRRVDIQALLKAKNDPKPIRDIRVNPCVWTSMKALADLYADLEDVDMNTLLDVEITGDGFSDVFKPLFDYLDKELPGCSFEFQMEDFIYSGLYGSEFLSFYVPCFDPSEEYAWTLEAFLSDRETLARKIACDYGELDDEQLAEYFTEEEVGVIQATGVDFRVLLNCYAESKREKSVDLDALFSFQDIFTPVIEKHPKLKEMTLALVTDMMESFYIEEKADFTMYIDYCKAHEELCCMIPQEVWNWDGHYYTETGEPGLVMFIKELVKTYKEEAERTGPEDAVTEVCHERKAA